MFAPEPARPWCIQRENGLLRVVTCAANVKKRLRLRLQEARSCDSHNATRCQMCTASVLPLPGLDVPQSHRAVRINAARAHSSCSVRSAAWLVARGCTSGARLVPRGAGTAARHRSHRSPTRSQLSTLVTKDVVPEFVAAPCPPCCCLPRLGAVRRGGRRQRPRRRARSPGRIACRTAYRCVMARGRHASLVAILVAALCDTAASLVIGVAAAESAATAAHS